jgi:hypothetical protein
VILATCLIRELRDRLHARAYEQHSRGHAEAAQALWAVVEELDVLLTHLKERRR